MIKYLGDEGYKGSKTLEKLLSSSACRFREKRRSHDKYGQPAQVQHCPTAVWLASCGACDADRKEEAQLMKLSNWQEGVENTEVHPSLGSPLASCLAALF